MKENSNGKSKANDYFASSTTTPSPFGFDSISLSVCDACGEWAGETRQLGPVESSAYLW